MTILSVKGTRDFYPEDMSIRTWLYQQIRQVSESYGYQEYEAPFLEKIDLYAAKSGEELVKEQAFVFQDRGGGEITLRPELTPSLARMIAQRQNQLLFPLRWWSFGPFWRYERPQKGRTREFFQWNIDMIGSDTPEADAELVSVCASFFKQVNLSPQQVKIFVNDRQLLNSKLENIGIINEKKINVFHLIDRRDKMASTEWVDYGLEIGLSREQIDQLNKLLSDEDMWKESKEMQRFYDAIDMLRVGEYVCFKPSVVRGLDYYTGIVLEAQEVDGGRAILGGGRYDNLVKDVGGKPLPGTGYAMGDVMISIVLKKYNLLPHFKISPALVMIAVFDETRVKKAYNLGAELRNAGINVMVYPEATKLPKQYKFADKMGIHYVIIEGPDEEARNIISVKNLVSGTQKNLGRLTVIDEIIQMLAEEKSM